MSEYTDIQKRCDKNINDILNICLKYDTNTLSGRGALVVYDTRHDLAKILLESYRKSLPDAIYIDFDTSDKGMIIESFKKMKSGDTVILIQSTNFLLNEFRIRLHLFNQGLKVIEHMHLTRNRESVYDVYIDSLAYDISWYPVIAPKLKDKLDNAKSLTIKSKDTTLFIDSTLEDAKLNIGDYTGMTNVGGTFPIGEVFTESENFEAMNGEIYIYAFAGSDFNVSMHEPFKIKIQDGLVTEYDENTPESFKEILKVVKDYERPLIREIGFGLNRAITRERYMGDITAFERILGMHMSLGEKHSVYKKEGLATKKTKFHIDIFPVVDNVLADDTQIFDGKRYTL